jgi:two-component system sensor histidine kinase HydH
MQARPSQPKRLAWFSPWLIIGSVCVLGAILLILTVRDVRQQKEFMVRTLVSEADILVHSLAASSRTGMMGMGWGRGQLQRLMEETAQQPDIHYVALVTSSGRIVAHSDPAEIGKTLDQPLPASGKSRYRFTGGKKRSFEVIHPYSPWRGRHGRGERCESSCPFPQLDSENGGFVLVGLDPSPFETAIHHDIQQTLIITLVLFLIGAAALVSLTWAQHYRSARRSLQDIEAFTDTILNQMPVGLIAADQEGRIKRANEAAGQILRQEVNAGAPLDGFPSFLPVTRLLRQQGSVIEEEVLFSGGNGLTVPLHVNAAMIRDGDQRNAGSVILFTDMTNIRQLEEQLHRSERLAALGRLAAGVAHEIRNPLSSIKGFAKILAGKIKDDTQGQKIAQVMEQEVERLNRVISELLEFARPTDLHKRLYPCSDLIRHTLRLIEQDAVQQGVKIEPPRVEPEGLEAEVDPDRFSQVLLNLYLNAIQAMDSGGSLKINVREQRGELLWTVSDSGRGISPEDQAHVFDPYFTTKPRGVGLGLAIVHKLVEAHGGDIDVMSTPGQGSSFVIRLPLSQQPAQPPSFA